MDCSKARMGWKITALAPGWGLRTRLAGVLAAYTLGRYLVATFC